MGTQQLCLAAVGTCRDSRGRAWVLVGCAGCQGSLGCQSLRGAFQVGQGSRAACGIAVPVPRPEQAPRSPRILNKFLDSYQEDVLPWHECVEPCVSFLSSHSSSWEVRGPRGAAGRGGRAGCASARPGLGKQSSAGGSLASCPRLAQVGVAVLAVAGCAWPGSGGCWGWDEGNGAWGCWGPGELPAVPPVLRAASQQVLQEVVGFLHRLGSASKDCVVVMCHVGTQEAVSKALEKHSTVPPLAPALLELVAECEKYSRLYRELTSSILAGCIQVGLGLWAWAIRLSLQ